jgi:hypothetical protein
VFCAFAATGIAINAAIAANLSLIIILFIEASAVVSIELPQTRCR